VIVIVGVLSGVALPNLLGNRDRAQAQSEIGPAVSYAKQCSTNMLTESPVDIPNIPPFVTPAPLADNCFEVATGAIATTFTVGGAAYTNPEKLEGLQCSVIAATQLPELNNGTEDTCTITVNAGPNPNEGVITGEWS
jgi:type II secretory pathway pseudopilin PulG